MPIYMNVIPLDRVVVIVARGHVSADEIAENTRALIAANVPGYAKIIDVTGSASNLTEDQVNGIAAMLRGGPEAGRGPVAFVVDPARAGFADRFAHATQDERPIQLFRSLHDARKWLKENTLRGGHTSRG
jgi:hypothetical protein